MAKQRLLLQMLHAPSDADYVEGFQALAAVNLEIRRTGPDVARLLRKAALEMDIGNHAAALAAARHASQLAPREAEPHFVAARALVLLALVRARAIPSTPGAVDETQEPATELVADAAREFRAAARANPDDQETVEDIAVLDALLQAHPSEATLLRALKAQAGPTA